MRRWKVEKLESENVKRNLDIIEDIKWFNEICQQIIIKDYEENKSVVLKMWEQDD